MKLAERRKGCLAPLTIYFVIRLAPPSRHAWSLNRGYLPARQNVLPHHSFFDELTDRGTSKHLHQAKCDDRESLISLPIFMLRICCWQKDIKYSTSKERRLRVITRLAQPPAFLSLIFVSLAS